NHTTSPLEASGRPATALLLTTFNTECQSMTPLNEVSPAAGPPERIQGRKERFAWELAISNKSPTSVSPGVYGSRFETFTVTGVALAGRTRSLRYDTTVLRSGVLVVSS